MVATKLVLSFLLATVTQVSSFGVLHAPQRTTTWSSLASTTESATESDPSTVQVDPKEAVKLFGRLAEKYIMLDESGGMCCYSACSDCQYRLPGGGYIMADQSAARPKWIPNYESRSINGKDHTTKWSTELFVNGPAVSQDLFVEYIKELAYAPPLGGPFVAASGAAIQDETAARALFDLLANGKETLTKHKMSVRIKQLSGGEEGMTWAMFQKAMGF